MTIVLRLPPELHEEIKQISVREDRTVTAQITRYLRACVEEDQRRHQRSGDDEQAQQP